MIDIEQICKKYGIKAYKDLGQNFLKNDNVLRQTIEVAHLNAEDVVLEIGPGLGVLTQYLVQEAGQVLAVELDERLIPILQKEFKSEENLHIEHANILDIPNSELLQRFGQDITQGYKVVANIPYNITSPILRKFTEQQPIPSECTFLVQKEVAERVTAKPGKLSILGVATQFYTDAQYCFTVPAHDFLPAPKVDSAVIHLKAHDRYVQILAKKNISNKDFFKVVRIGFSSKRKQLHNNISAGFSCGSDDIKAVLQDVGLKETVRAQELTIEQWIDLAARLQLL